VAEKTTILGEGVYQWFMRLFGMIQQVGLLRTLSGLVAQLFIATFRYAWKARLVMHWRLSPQVTQEVYTARQAVCATCDSLEKEDGGSYCKSCGCRHWAWSELSVKNTREGHRCPLGKHEGSKKRGGCSGCGGNVGTPTNGNGRVRELEVARLARERVRKIQELEPENRLTGV
jgi:hypothetical protein